MPSRRINRGTTAWIAVGAAAGLAVIATPPGADAQRGARAQYTMVSGRVQGSTEEVIYIFDGANEELAAFRWKQGTNALAPTGYRNVRDDASRGVGGGR